MSERLLWCPDCGKNKVRWFSGSDCYVCLECSWNTWTNDYRDKVMEVSRIALEEALEEL